MELRADWIARLDRLAAAPLEAIAAGRFTRSMPCEQQAGADRRRVTGLECIARLLVGLAPWFACPDLEPDEAALRDRRLTQARAALAAIVDPASPDRLDFTLPGQPVVDAAFLAQALLRAPAQLWEPLDQTTRGRLATALATAGATTIPPHNNWLLFFACCQAALCRFGLPYDPLRVDYALRMHARWYLGDGVYGDGPEWHWDYYNSFVIQPMLVDVLDACTEPRLLGIVPPAIAGARLARWAEVQERLVAPDGSFPVIGRSIAYRCGAFQGLAAAALRRRLPPSLPPAQARGALGAVIARTLDPAGTWDADGWLRIGLAGHQPALGEAYISTGSLYLASTAFLPLGLPPSDPFWSAPARAWTSRRAWAGEDLPADHALH